MARAIRNPPTPAPNDEAPLAARALAPDLADATGAVRELLALLRGLEEKGYLRFANDLLGSEDRVVKVLTERIDPGELRRGIEGLRTLLAMLGEVDRELVGRFSPRLGPALAEARRAEGGPPVGFLEVVNALNDPEVNRGVRMGLGFLRGIGRTPPE